MPGKPIKKYTCKKGHEYLDFGPWAITMKIGKVFDQDVETIETGPLCPFCYVAWMKKQFRMEEEDV